MAAATQAPLAGTYRTLPLEEELAKNLFLAGYGVNQVSEYLLKPKGGVSRLLTRMMVNEPPVSDSESSSERGPTKRASSAKTFKGGFATRTRCEAMEVIFSYVFKTKRMIIIFCPWFSFHNKTMKMMTVRCISYNSEAAAPLLTTPRTIKMRTVPYIFCESEVLRPPPAEKQFRQRAHTHH